MKNIKAIIIDDELDSLETTQLLIQDCCPHVEILKLTNDEHEGIDAINELKPDLVFLDISMPKMDGFELLSRVKYQAFEVIFTTAYDEFAIKAFQVGATHYLLKPISRKELREAVSRVREKLKENKDSPNVHSILSQITANRQPKIAIPSIKGIEMLEIDNIIRCEADSNYSIIHMISSKVVVTKTLKELESQLERYNFIRTHNSHLINLAHLKTYLKGEGGTVILSNGDAVSVSRSRKSLLMEKLEQF